MKKNVENDYEILIPLLFEGLSMLSGDEEVASSCFFSEEKFPSNISQQAIEFVELLGKPRNFLRNPDLFYVMLQYGMSCGFSLNEEKADFLKGLTPREFIDDLLTSSYGSFPVLEDLNQRLAQSVPKYMGVSDEQLKDHAKAAFSVNDLNIVSSPSPLIYTKINHGYWEFLLNSFIRVDEKSPYRNLSKTGHPKSWMVSGFHATLLNAFELSLLTSDNAKRPKIGVSMSAGDKPYSSTVGSELSPMSRGALTGLCGFLDGLANKQPFKFFEGSAPRDMIKNGDYVEFFTNTLNGYCAAIVIVPPGLKNIKIHAFEGSVYVLSIPGQKVHETHRVLVPMILGLIKKTQMKHGSVAIVTQCAVLAPLLAIYIARFFDDDRAPVAFYDLGRVLDISRPDLVSGFPSLAWVVETGLYKDIHLYFSLNDNGGDIKLFHEA